MPGRRDSFSNNGTYHIFNRTIDGEKIFSHPSLSVLFLDTLCYYRSSLIDRSFSHFKLLDKSIQEKQKTKLSIQKFFIIDILGYCLMPTHFHFLVRQRIDDGARVFMSNVMNSFTRHYNVKNHRKGPLFLPRFQSREILTDELIMHVSRYQHLNPFSGGLVDTLEELTEYPWSSYASYVNGTVSPVVNCKPVLQLFGNDGRQYKQFIEDQADYQQSLEELKYLNRW